MKCCDLVLPPKLAQEWACFEGFQCAQKAWAVVELARFFLRCENRQNEVSSTWGELYSPGPLSGAASPSPTQETASTPSSTEAVTFAAVAWARNYRLHFSSRGKMSTLSPADPIHSGLVERSGRYFFSLPEAQTKRYGDPTREDEETRYSDRWMRRQYTPRAPNLCAECGKQNSLMTSSRCLQARYRSECQHAPRKVTSRAAVWGVLAPNLDRSSNIQQAYDTERGTKSSSSLRLPLESKHAFTSRSITASLRGGC